MLDYDILNKKPTLLANSNDEFIDLAQQTYNIKNTVKGEILIVNKYYVARPDLISLAVYGDDKYADIIVITTHQLYRYKKYFSLIILDEIDAFPFKGDPILRSMFFESLNGHYVMMSATPSKDVIDHFKKPNKDILKLETRFHRHPLPVPIILKGINIYIFYLLIRYIRKYLNQNKPIFIFAPTISECESLYKKISLIFKGGNFVHSKRKNRSEIIDAFRKGIFKYLVTTSVLERGVTVKDLQVIVYKSDSFVYEKGTLIQIAGRVGRKIDAPSGEVIFLANKVTEDMKGAIHDIEESNKALQDLL